MPQAPPVRWLRVLLVGSAMRVFRAAVLGSILKFCAGVEEWKNGWKIKGLASARAVSALPLMSCFSVIFKGLVGCLGDGPIAGRVGKADFAAGADGHGKPWPVPDWQPGNAPGAIRPAIPCPPEQGGRGPSGCKQGFPVLCDPCPGGPEVRPLRFARAGVRGVGLVRGVSPPIKG